MRRPRNTRHTPRQRCRAATGCGDGATRFASFDSTALTITTPTLIATTNPNAYSSGRKLTIKLRSNSAAFGGFGSGDASMTARSIERRTASSPLQLADLCAHDVARRQLHDVDDAVDARPRARAAGPSCCLMRFSIITDVLIEQARRSRRIRLGLVRELRCQHPISACCCAARAARPRASSAASRSRCACASRLALLARLAARGVPLAALSAATRSRSFCAASSRARCSAATRCSSRCCACALLLGRFATLAVLALLALALLSRGVLARLLLALDRRRVDDRADDRRRRYLHGAAAGATGCPSMRTASDCDVQRQRPNDRLPCVGHEAHLPLKSAASRVALGIVRIRLEADLRGTGLLQQHGTRARRGRTARTRRL